MNKTDKNPNATKSWDLSSFQLLVQWSLYNAGFSPIRKKWEEHWQKTQLFQVQELMHGWTSCQILCGACDSRTGLSETLLCQAQNKWGSDLYQLKSWNCIDLECKKPEELRMPAYESHSNVQKELKYGLGPMATLLSKHSNSHQSVPLVPNEQFVIFIDRKGAKTNCCHVKETLETIENMKSDLNILDCKVGDHGELWKS